MPQTVFATTSNADLQCFRVDCENVGTSYCMWPTAWCSCRLKAGCKRRFCQLHKFEKKKKTRTKRCYRYETFLNCPECGPALETDMVRNARISCFCFFCFFSFLMIISFTPMIVSFSDRPTPCKSTAC